MRSKFIIPMACALVISWLGVTNWMVRQAWAMGYASGERSVAADIAGKLQRQGSFTLTSGDSASGWIAHCKCERTD